jgi:hypothetical protein
MEVTAAAAAPTMATLAEPVARAFTATAVLSIGAIRGRDYQWNQSLNFS